MRTAGFSLVEIVIAASLVLALSTVFTAAYLDAQQNTEIAGQRMRANLLAEEGLETARSIRDMGFANLVNGTYGVSTTSTTAAFSGTSDTEDIFTRAVTISTVSTNTKQVSCTVTWPENALRNGSTTLVTYLSNTQLMSQQATDLQVTFAGAFLSGLTFTTLQGIYVQDIGSSPITITKVTVSWSTSILNKITSLLIGGTTVWSSTGPGTPSGAQSSGTTLTPQTVTLSPGASATPTAYVFNGLMVLNIYTITFTMGDGSTKTISTLQL